MKNFKRGRIIQDTSFTLHSGEILGISGLVGSGRTELLRAIFGADKIDSGTLQVGDPLKTVVIRSPKDAIKHGIALVTEDRKGEGLLLPQSIAANISLGNSDKTSFLSIVSSLDETNLANKYIKNLGIRATNPSQPVKSLSGGNQQKVLISRWLERDCQIILFDEPTRGIDIGAKQDIYQLLNALTAKGKGIVVVSSDLRELMLICDRIAVISDGKLVNTFSRGDWSQEQILAAAFSAYQHVENTSSE